MGMEIEGLMGLIVQGIERGSVVMVGVGRGGRGDSR
jgi:hypothetical protein